MEILKTLLTIMACATCGAFFGLELHKTYAWVNWPVSALAGSLLGLICSGPIKLVLAIKQSAISSARSIKEFDLPTKEERDLLYESFLEIFYKNTLLFSWVVILFLTFTKLENFYRPDHDKNDLVVCVVIVFCYYIITLVVSTITTYIDLARYRSKGYDNTYKYESLMALKKYNPIAVSWRLLCASLMLMRKYTTVVLKFVALTFVGTIRICSDNRAVTITVSSGIGSAVGFVCGAAILGGTTGALVGTIFIVISIWFRERDLN